MLLGLVAWLVVPLTLLPLRAGQPPSWALPRAAALFPALLLCLAAGAAAGPALRMGLDRRAARRLAARAVAGGRVVVLGGGFGGVAAARRLERLLPRSPGLEVTLVSRGNHLLFTPMLAEVAAGAVQPGGIGVPLRALCPRTRVVQAEVAGVDLAARTVRLRTAAGEGEETLAYDHLVLALGAAPDLLDLPGVAAHALTLKSLEDAVRLRDHVIAQLERADLVADPAERRRLLTFVVAGGGFAGVEAVAALAGLVRSVLGYYPGVAAAEPRFVLVHSRQRILPELGPELAGYAHRKLRARGIELRLGARVVAAAEGAVALADGELLPARTLVWTAGNRPSPLLGDLGLARDGGAVPVDPSLRVRGLDGVWAMGDCARVPDLARGGVPCPPTAQHALRQGEAVAGNLVAAMAGRKPRPFRYRARGFLVALGHQSAAAELRRLRLSGLPAWLLWRGLYLAKLPGAEKRLRVLLDWALELLFARDITLAGGPSLSSSRARPAGAGGASGTGAAAGGGRAGGARRGSRRRVA